MESPTLVTPGENGSLTVGAHQMCWPAPSSAMVEEAPLNSHKVCCQQLLWLSSDQRVLVKNTAQSQELKGCSALLEDPAINCIRGALTSKSTHPCMSILAQI